MPGSANTGVIHDFSIYGMVANADPVVQAVMLGLVVASVICWAIVFEKIIRMGWLKRDVRELSAAAERGAFSGDEKGHVARAIYGAAHDESVEGAAQGEDQNAVRSRLERAMRGTLKSALRKNESGLPFLATVGSAAPFVGLFGTVWGIMNSFTSIAQSKDTSLAVVAPGIAEALFATGLGLAAAIPAVIAYNHFAVSLGRKGELMSGSVQTLAKRMARGQRITAVREEAA